MAELTRKALRTIFEDAGIEIPPKDVLGQICELHTSAIDSMTESIKDLTAKLEVAEHERDVAKEGANADSEYKTKYESTLAELDGLKNDIKTKEAYNAKETAFRNLLKDAGISSKRYDVIVKASKDAINALEIDEEGKLKDSESHLDGIKADWSDFIVTETTTGAKTATPPANNGGVTRTKAEIIAIKDAAERQKAIAENPALFGISAE